MTFLCLKQQIGKITTCWKNNYAGIIWRVFTKLCVFLVFQKFFLNSPHQTSLLFGFISFGHNHSTRFQTSVPRKLTWRLWNVFSSYLRRKMLFFVMCRELVNCFPHFFGNSLASTRLSSSEQLGDTFTHTEKLFCSIICDLRFRMQASGIFM